MPWMADFLHIVECECYMSYLNTENLFKISKFIPVVVINEESETEKILSALLESGINVAEITFRTACAEEAIKKGKELFPHMTIGAGTVINAEQAESALKAGAEFIVSPGFSKPVADVCKNADIPYIPGCVTPTEIMAALECGINTVKFFPANIYGGIKGIKALSAPFPQVKFVPTGGIDRNNINDYLEFEKVIAIGGSFFVKEALEKYREKREL